jgi:hypothetical protein
VMVWPPITIVDAPAGTETRMPSIMNVVSPGEAGGPNVGTANVLDIVPPTPATTTPDGFNWKTELPTVTGGPFKKAVWLPITTLVASGAAEITLLPIVAIGIGATVGLGMNVLEPAFPPIWIPVDATDTTTAWL